MKEYSYADTKWVGGLSQKRTHVYRLGDFKVSNNVFSESIFKRSVIDVFPNVQTVLFCVGDGEDQTVPWDRYAIMFNIWR